MRSEASVAYRRSSADRAASGTIWPFFPSFIFLPFFQSYATAYIPISLALSQQWKTTKTNTLDTTISDHLLLLKCVSVISKYFARARRADGSSVRTSAYIADHGRLSHRVCCSSPGVVRENSSSRKASSPVGRYEAFKNGVKMATTSMSLSFLLSGFSGLEL
jgi:hypothetical protein